MRWTDGRCYKLYSLGPCHRDQVYLSSSSGPYCAAFIDEDEDSNEVISDDNEVISDDTKVTQQLGWTVPREGQYLSREERNCLSQEKVNM